MDHHSGIVIKYRGAFRRINICVCWDYEGMVPFMINIYSCRRKVWSSWASYRSSGDGIFIGGVRCGSVLISSTLFVNLSRDWISLSEFYVCQFGGVSLANSSAFRSRCMVLHCGEALNQTLKLFFSENNYIYKWIICKNLCWFTPPFNSWESIYKLSFSFKINTAFLFSTAVTANHIGRSWIFCHMAPWLSC